GIAGVDDPKRADELDALSIAPLTVIDMKHVAYSDTPNEVRLAMGAPAVCTPAKKLVIQSELLRRLEARPAPPILVLRIRRLVEPLLHRRHHPGSRSLSLCESCTPPELVVAGEPDALAQEVEEVAQHAAGVEGCEPDSSRGGSSVAASAFSTA